MGNSRGLTTNENTASGEQGTYHLYASPATRQLLGGLADAMPGWAGMDVMVISRRDALDSVNRVFDRHQSKGGSIPGALSLAFNDMAQGLGYDHPISHMHNGESYITRTQIQQAAAMATVNNAPSAKALNTGDPMATHGNLCVISVPDTPDVRELKISTWTNMHGIEGTFDLGPTQILTFAMAHESGHCGQPMREKNAPGTSALREAEVDQHGLNVLRELMGGDSEQYRKTAQEFVDLRALESVNNFDVSHATSPALNIDGRTANLGALDTDGAPRHRLDLHDGSPTTVGLAAVLNKVIDHVVRATDTDADEATRLLATDPDLMHESVKVLKAQGAFNASALQTKYVDQYLDAFSRHGQAFQNPPLQNILGLSPLAAPEPRTTASAPTMRP
jgi:hypothetical protein